MQLIYSGQDKSIIGRSIFLAGCSPRKGQILTWRLEAISYFQQYEFEGTLIIPEPENGESWIDYFQVVEWEDKHLQLADVILFWIPRSIKDEIYGFTSNVEFGKYLYSDKILYGRPDDSDNNRYLDYWYEKIYEKKPRNNLSKLVFDCLD